MTSKLKLKPGQPAPVSGQYVESKTGREITAIKNKPLPPTTEPGLTYRVSDPTKNSSGKPD